nr:immunoglobulin light chain junction region [Macaca mulatta]
CAVWDNSLSGYIF